MRSKISMFVPAAGLGTRVEEFGKKPFLDIHGDIALNHVIAQGPAGAGLEIALPLAYGCPPLNRPATVYFVTPEQSKSQANTIYNWLNGPAADRVDYVLISNCDNVIDQRTIQDGIDATFLKTCSGVVYTFTPAQKDDERFSYVHTNPKGIIKAVRENVPLSTRAVAGVYFLFMPFLRAELRESDQHLSQALDRMQGLRAMQAREYYGWNDAAQYLELRNGVKQYR